MRIAFVINDVSNIGGTERVTTHLASICAQQGHYVTVVSVYQSSPQCFFPISEKVVLSSLFKHPQHLLKHVFAIGKALKNFAKNFDLIILSDSQLGVLLPLVKRNNQCKWLVWEHFNSSIETTFGSRWFGRRLAAMLSHGIVVLTEQDKKHWQHKYWLRVPLYNVANPCSVAITQARHEPQYNRVISVGRFTEQKGFDLLVSAWAALPSNLTQQWQLHIVGPNGSAKPALQQQIRNLGLSNVILKDATQTITDEFDTADIYVMASRYEGFGLTLIEAMSRGLPSIAFDCPMGPGEILNYGEFGEVVSPQNVSGLTQAMQTIMQSQTQYCQRSQAAINRAESYQDAIIYQQWQEVWQEQGLTA